LSTPFAGAGKIVQSGRLPPGFLGDYIFEGGTVKQKGGMLEILRRYMSSIKLDWWKTLISSSMPKIEGFITTA
jgi:hypothetical protein